MLEGIKNWLTYSRHLQELECPFIDFTGVAFCADHFTKIGKKFFLGNYCSSTPCPCSVYPHKYIVKRAEHFLKIYGNSNG